MADIGGGQVNVFADGGDGQVRIGIIVLDEFDNSVYGRIAVFSFVERIIILVDALNQKIFELCDERKVLDMDPNILLLADFFGVICSSCSRRISSQIKA